MKLNKITMVHHHVCYEEIHGYDFVILIPLSEHKKLHNRLRKTGKCNIPSKELDKISQKACMKRNGKKYNKNCKRLIFSNLIEKGATLQEQIIYNHKNGNVYYSSNFRKTNGQSLPVMNLES